MKKILYITFHVIGLSAAAVLFAAVLYTLNSGKIEERLFDETSRGLDIGIEYYEENEQTILQTIDEAINYIVTYHSGTSVDTTESES